MTFCVSYFWREKMLSCLEADSEEYTAYIRDTAHWGLLFSQVDNVAAISCHRPGLHFYPSVVSFQSINGQEMQIIVN